MFIIEKAKRFFHKEIEKCWLSDHFKDHLDEFEKWANKMLAKYPEADYEAWKMLITAYRKINI